MIGDEKGNDIQQKNLSIVRQILHVSASVKVYRIVWHICIMILGCNRLAKRQIQYRMVQHFYHMLAWKGEVDWTNLEKLIKLMFYS